MNMVKSHSWFPQNEENKVRFMVDHMERLVKGIVEFLPSRNEISKARKQLDQLEADAELGRYVKTVFKREGFIELDELIYESDDESATTVILDTIERFIKWGKGKVE